MSIFSRLFKIFLIAVFTPLLLAAVLLFYYQNNSKSNILKNQYYLASIVSFSMGRYIDGLGEQLSFTKNIDGHSADKKRVNDLFNGAIALHPDFLMFALLDSGGRQITASGPRHILEALGEVDLSAEKDYLSDLSKAGSVSVSSFDLQLGLPVAEVLLPLKDGNFVFGAVSFFSLWSGLQRLDVGETGHIFLVHKNGQPFMLEENYFPYSVEQMAKYIEAREPLIKKLDGDGGERIVGAVAPSPVSDAFIAVLQNSKETYSNINLINWFGAFFLLAIATLSYFAALRFASGLSEPIGALIEGAEKVSGGDFDVKVEKDFEWPEFDQLIDSFNRMTVDVKKYRDLKIRQELSEMKEGVFRSVAHDLRAPVLGLAGYLELLSSSEVPAEEKAKYIGIMKTAVRDLSGLLEDVLDVSRIEAGISTVRKSCFSFNEMLDEALGILGPLAAQKNIELKKEILSEEPLCGDRKLLSRMLLNLVSNAIKFTESGTVAVSYSKENENFLIKVKDSGKGIAEEDIESIFEKYHQLDNSAPGHGLGLAISRQIALAHGGGIAAESEQGKGTVFTVTIPAGGV